jgi:hypothetical protein
MPTYLLAYHGISLPKREAEQPDLVRAWNEWMDRLGDALEGSNNPINVARTINSDGTVSTGAGANPVMGLSFVTADNIDAAVELARSCPHLAAGGSVEVAEIVPRSGR